MNKPQKAFVFVTLFLIGSQFNFLQAQTTAEIKDGLYKIMLAFPDNFRSLRGQSASNTDPNSFHSNYEIPGTYFCTINKNDDNGSWEWAGTVTTSDDEEDEDKMEKIFKQWKTSIDNVDFNGIKLIPYKDDRYTTKYTDILYEEGFAWRLDNSRNNVDTRYKKFTVRLEVFQYKKDGYLVVQLLVSDN